MKRFPIQLTYLWIETQQITQHESAKFLGVSSDSGLKNPRERNNLGERFLLLFLSTT